MNLENLKEATTLIFFKQQTEQATSENDRYEGILLN